MDVKLSSNVKGSPTQGKCSCRTSMGDLTWLVISPWVHGRLKSNTSYKCGDVSQIQLGMLAGTWIFGVWEVHDVPLSLTSSRFPGSFRRVGLASHGLAVGHETRSEVLVFSCFIVLDTQLIAAWPALMVPMNARRGHVKVIFSVRERILASWARNFRGALPERIMVMWMAPIVSICLVFGFHGQRESGPFSHPRNHDDFRECTFLVSSGVAELLDR